MRNGVKPANIVLLAVVFFLAVGCAAVSPPAVIAPGSPVQGHHSAAIILLQKKVIQKKIDCKRGDAAACGVAARLSSELDAAIQQAKEDSTK